MDAKVSSVNEKPIHVVLLANKCDMLLQNSIFNQQRGQMDEFCQENGIAGWFETSAAIGYGIEEAANFLLSKIVEDKPLSDGEKGNGGTGVKINRRPVKQDDG